MNIQIQSISDENISEIAANIIDENDGTFDLTAEIGIVEACYYAIDYYKAAGFELNYADIKRELDRKIRALKELELM